MTIRKIISIDYNACLYFTLLIILFLAIILCTAVLFFNITSDEYDKSSAMGLFSLSIVFSPIFLICFIKRINVINKILKYGSIAIMEIKESKNWPKDKYVCVLNDYGQCIQTALRVSKKNKSKLDEYCKIGNKVTAGFLENNRKKIILIDLYKSL